MDWSRRRVLAAAGLAGASGCTAPSIGNGDDGTPDETTPTATPASGSDDGTDGGDTPEVEYDEEWEAPTDSPAAELDVETVIEGLEIPWDLAFAPNGDLFVSERPGRILRYEAGTVEAVAEPDDIADAGAIDADEEGGWWAAGGEGGLMGIAVHPDYPDDGRVYAVYTYSVDGEDRNKLVAYDIGADDTAASAEPLIEEIPGDNIHNGSRLAFGPEENLWMTTGDAGEGDLAQDPSSLAGKVLRLTPDGEAPGDNPDIDGGDPRVYSYGHRNPQGITFLPDGRPVVTEHGPSARDEVNVLRPGENYGWPAARNEGEYGGYHPPLVNTGPSETWAPPGCVFYRGDGRRSDGGGDGDSDADADGVPAWEHRLIVGGLRSQRINVVTVYRDGTEEPTAEGGTRFDADWLDPDYRAVAHPLLEDELGRIRHIEEGPGGEVYAITSNRDGRATEEFPRENDDRLVRIRQA